MNAILDRTFPSTATSAASFRSGVSPGILYVDDDAMIRSIYGEILLRFRNPAVPGFNLSESRHDQQIIPAV